MVTIPNFILRRLYVKGSLRNVDDGVEFQILNKLGAGQARRMAPLVFDGEATDIAACTFTIDGETMPFAAVTAERPFAMALNKLTTIRADGVTLSEGAHTVLMSFEVPGLGSLKFDFVDTI